MLFLSLCKARGCQGQLCSVLIELSLSEDVLIPLLVSSNWSSNRSTIPLAGINPPQYVYVLWLPLSMVSIVGTLDIRGDKIGFDCPSPLTSTASHKPVFGAVEISLVWSGNYKSSHLRDSKLRLPSVGILLSRLQTLISISLQPVQCWDVSFSSPSQAVLIESNGLLKTDYTFSLLPHFLSYRACSRMWSDSYVPINFTKCLKVLLSSKLFASLFVSADCTTFSSLLTCGMWQICSV